MTVVDPDARYAVTFDPVVVETLRIACSRSGGRETGGILIGRYSQLGDQVAIEVATYPPADSRRARTAFVRGTDGLTETLQRAWDADASHYVGEWHYHPGSVPAPSACDIRQMREFAADPNHRCPRPVLAVVGQPRTGVFLIHTSVHGDGRVVTLRPEGIAGPGHLLDISRPATR